MKKIFLFSKIVFVLFFLFSNTIYANSFTRIKNSKVNFSPKCETGVTLINSNFNGTSIAAGNYIWFNSILKVSGAGNQPITILFTNQTITIGSNTIVDVPDSSITISPTNTMGTTIFDGTRWVNNYPNSIASEKNFLSGYSYFLGNTGMPGGINPVTWRGHFYSTNPNIEISWQWAAAVYTNFSSNHALLGVKPTSSNNTSIYLNSNHAGSPQNYKQFVTGGARGGGGSNYTGSYSGTKKLNPCEFPTIDRSSQSKPLANIENSLDIQLFPNPIDNIFSIKSKNLNENSILQVYIYNYQNALVFEKHNVLDDQEIDISNLPSGIYMVNIINESTNKIIKVIKK